MPIVDEKAPREADFDALLDLLRPLDNDCAAVFNCQERKKFTLKTYHHILNYLLKFTFEN